MVTPRIAIIGAGLAGLTCARTLAAAGYAVCVFDKGRTPGGRMATRRSEPFRFDHGAQFFTAREPRFAAAVAGWQELGVAAPWRGRTVTRNGESNGAGLSPVALTEPRYVGEPGMNGIGRHLAVGLTVRLGCEVIALTRRGGGWRLVFSGGGEADGFDIVLVTTPAPQAAPLLTAAPKLAAAAAGAVLAPCWAVMLAFDESVPTPFDAVQNPAGPVVNPVAWAARDGSKPGRPPAETWVLHAGPEWSAEHLEDDADSVAAALSAAFEALAQVRLPPPLFVRAHRWRHALVTRAVGEASLFDAGLGLAAAGDWCVGGRVEAAFLSGLDAAERILGGGNGGRTAAA